MDQNRNTPDAAVSNVYHSSTTLMRTERPSIVICGDMLQLGKCVSQVSGGRGRRRQVQGVAPNASGRILRNFLR